MFSHREHYGRRLSLPCEALIANYTRARYFTDEEQLVRESLEVLRILILHGHVDLEAAGVHEEHDEETREEFIRTHIDIEDWQPALFGQFHVYVFSLSWRAKWWEIPVNPDNFAPLGELFIEETR